LRAAIQFDGVSKKFILHHERARSFQELVVGLFRRNNRSREEFWALRDVSFAVEQGETVGIIGPNGAGKSTLLKLAARVIEPTSGRIAVRGRIGALLELGAGFHPDLTGRENIYLNGSILGLSRAEIRRRMDDIIGFAELERFIDVPVKHYSSGMFVRLGFSVAVHTDPEILLVDEVLAVGDQAFQRKCLERIDDLRRQGVTVLFVSHSADAVRALCNRAIWLYEGRVVADDAAEAVVRRYLEHSWGRQTVTQPGGDERRWGTGRIRIVRVRLLDGEGRERQQFRTGEPLVVEMHYRAEERVERPVFGLAIHRSDGIHITGPNTQFAGLDIPAVEGEGIVTYAIPALPLLEGLYYISVSTHNWEDTEMYDYHDRMYGFWVLPGTREEYGIVTVMGVWRWEVDGYKLAGETDQ
jgi:ABC-type polysaccharide/polyol phosphate transport system ATPase subunit